MDKLSWFPMLTNDFLGSTKVALMTTEEIGAYALLMCHEWNDARCSLPDDDEALRKLGRITGDLTRIRACFVRRGTRLVNLKLVGVWKEQQEKHRLRVSAGKTGSEKRWGSKASSNAMPELVAPEKQSESESESESEDRRKKKRKSGTHAMPEGWSLSDAMQHYGLKKGMTEATALQEFEHCREHHEKAGSRWTEKGWASSVWSTWVLNWIKFGSQQVVLPALVTHPKCAFHVPCDERAVSGSKYCQAHREFYQRQQARLKPGPVAGLAQDAQDDVTKLVGSLVQGKSMLVN